MLAPKTAEEFMALPVSEDYLVVTISPENQAQIRADHPELKDTCVGTTINIPVTPRFVPIDTAGDTIMMVRTKEGLWTLHGSGRRLMYA